MDTMLNSSDSPRVAGASVRHDDPAPRLARATARTILTTAVLLGISGDALLREGPVGLAFGVWIG